MPERGLLTSKVLPVPHGFSTRVGGCSEGPFASLNLGFSVGDARERVEANLKTVAGWLEVLPEELHTVSQVHGDTVLEARGAGAPGGLVGVSGEADALWTARKNAAVGVKTADCVPILLADPKTRQVAAVHSGWKGTDARIVARAVERLVAQGAKASDLRVAIGPSIRSCCYEVSDELADRFRSKFGQQAVVFQRGERAHLDLTAVISLTLSDVGVPGHQVEVLPNCTACDEVRFFSHRRDRGQTGRHLSVIVCRF
jgi:YfiH family protein